MSKRWIPVGLVLCLIFLVVWWWSPAPVDQEPATPPPVAHVVPQKEDVPVTRTAVRVETEDAPDEGVKPLPSPGAETAYMRRLAEWKDELFVSCFVGEGFSGMERVENGWFSTTTKERQGTTEVAEGMDTLLTVSWDAPEGVTEIECALDAPRFGYITVHVSDEQGDPLEGVALLGCGSLYETDANGKAEVSMLVLGRRCDMEVFKHEKTVEHRAYLRVLPLQEDETRTYRVTAVAYEIEEGETLHFDLAGLHNNDDAPITGAVELYEPEVEPLSLDDYEQRLSGMLSSEQMLREILAMTPEEERWYVDNLLAKNLDWQEDFREQIETLRADDGADKVGE